MLERRRLHLARRGRHRAPGLAGLRRRGIAILRAAAPTRRAALRERPSQPVTHGHRRDVGLGVAPPQHHRRLGLR
ncbi:MAG: hypothetical protein ABSH51_30205 [Solirubrobacteraceae bacterium]